MSGDAFNGAGNKIIKFAWIFLNSLLQAWNCDTVGAKPVIKVVPKFSFAAQLFKRFVCRGNYSPMEMLFFVAPNRGKNSLFQNLQQLYLNLNAYVSNFIEEYRAMRPA